MTYVAEQSDQCVMVDIHENAKERFRRVPSLN